MTYLPYILLAAPLLVRAVTTTPNTGDQTNGFLFDFIRSYPAPLPIIESCPGKLQFGPVTVPFGGAEPAPPFTAMFLVNEAYIGSSGTVNNRMYTHSTSFGDGKAINSVDIPMMNGSQFMVCMWAANGISGGCQDLYSVYASPNYSEVYANADSACRGDIAGSWVPPPNRQLAVDVFGANGVVAERAWPASCSDLKFTPKNGTAPYTLVISPAMHPPVNITSNTTFSDDNSMNYTIRLTHGSAFWTTIFDSDGASWSSGPYHAGTNQDVGCLATLTGQEGIGGVMADSPHPKGKGVGIGALAGGIVGAFVAGLILAALAMMLLAKKKKKSHNRNGSTESLDGYNDTQPRPAAWRSDTHTSIAKHPYPQAVTPYTEHSPLPGMNEDPYSAPALPYSPTNHRNSMAHLPDNHMSMSMDHNERAYRQSVGLGDFQPNPRSNGSASVPSASAPSDSGHPSSSAAGPVASGSGSGGRQVYVVHSDGGKNVHITLPEGGADVVELPPNYQNTGAGGSTPNPHGHGDDKSRMG